jgi:hypothetical protein
MGEDSEEDCFPSFSGDSPEEDSLPHRTSAHGQTGRSSSPLHPQSYLPFSAPPIGRSQSVVPEFSDRPHRECCLSRVSACSVMRQAIGEDHQVHCVLFQESVRAKFTDR